jgi:membrane protease YdiL (CAAX protease family)
MAEPAPEDPQSEEPTPADPRQTVVLLAIFVEGGLMLIATVLGWLLKQPPLEHFAWDGWAVLLGVAAAVPLVLVFLVMQRWPVGPLSRIRRFSEQVVRPLLAPCSVVDLLGISVLAGLGEEMLFRAVLQGAFAHYGAMPWLAVLAASLLFGLPHAVTFTYAVLATLMGAYLGTLWLLSGNLLVVVVTHALYDFLVLLWLLRGPGAAEALQALYEAEAEAQAKEERERSANPSGSRRE